MNDDQANGPASAGASDDLRSMLTNAFETADTPPAETPTEPADAAAPIDGPARDERGRFAPKQEQAPDAAAAPTEPSDPAQAAAIEPTPSAIEAPASWSAAAKAEWAKLSPAIQQEVLKREGDFTKGIEQKSLEAKKYEPVARLLESHQDVFQRYGVQPADGVERLLRVQRMLDTDPAGTIRQIAQAYGVDLSAAGQPQQDQPKVDPQLAPLLQEINGIKQYIATHQRTQAESERAALASQIEAFRSEANADGTPKRPHFEEVKALMGTLLGNGQAKDLQEAYDMAVYANPTVRARILEDQQRAAREKAQADAKAKAEAAKKLAVSPTGAPGLGSSPDSVPADSLRGELEKAFASRL